MVALVEVDLDQLAEATAVVVAQRLGVAERLQDGVGLRIASRRRGDGSDGGLSKAKLTEIMKSSIAQHFGKLTNTSRKGSVCAMRC